MAVESFKPIDPEEQEDVDWIRQKLIEADPKKYQIADSRWQVPQSPFRASTASPGPYAPASSPPKLLDWWKFLHRHQQSPH